ncbi:MAG: nucleotide sugar dehydrogenase [Candidatus Bathyarchaeota archaeon]|nr:nucleotide sugar dehydrogenase [Candidatus Bathyarchaeum tardum]
MRDIMFKEIKARNLRLTVLGCGYVGLPTAALFANAGFHVIALDLNSEIVKSVNSKFSPINEPDLDELVSNNIKSGRLQATLNSIEALTQADIVIISVQTPIDTNKKPNLSFLMNALENVGKNLKKQMFVAVCSTVPPRTMQETIKPLLESLSGLKADTDFYLAYVPERIAPGKALREFVESPRLVGGIGSNSTKIATELFRTVCKKIIETDATTAEIAKTAENTYRDVNIAFANQLAIICEEHGSDITKVIELANTHPRVNIHTSGPGVGGPCLTKDSYLLTHKSKPADYDIIKTARKINDNMPKHIVKLTLKALKNTNKNVRNSKIAILGTAYKANVDDSRSSPSESIIQNLIDLGAETIAYDPHCTNTFGAKKATSLHESIKNADCLIIATDHTEFKNLNLTEIKQSMRSKPIIIDGKRIINPKNAEKLGFTYYGIGYGKPSD